MMVVNRFHDAICGCCRRTAVGYGYSPSANWQRHPPILSCDDPECLAVIRNTYALPQEQFTRLESLAAGKGGEEGGAFLDTIGKTDLATLTPDEWFEFCRRVVSGYRVSLVELVKGEAPF